MPFTVDTKDGGQNVGGDVGDDKRLVIGPEDIQGDPTSASAIDATLTPENGTPVQLDINDFTQDGDSLVAIVGLDTAGDWDVDITVTGAGQGSVERVQGQVYVSP